MSRLRDFTALLALLLAASGCSNSRPDQIASSDDKPAKAQDDDDGDDEDLGGNDDGEITGDGTADYKGCGFKSLDDTSELISQTIGSADIRFHGFAGTIFTSEYNVTVRGGLVFAGGLTALKTTSRFDVVAADPPNARGKAEEEIRKVTGSRQATLLAPAKWAETFASGGAWAGLHCGVLPATALTEQTGVHTSSLKFEPPIPYLVSPLLSKARFAKEFPDARQFADVKVTVAQTSNQKIGAGQSATGKITITPITASGEFTDTQGRKRSVAADYAFRMEFDFGNHERTAAFGLYKVATYYVQDGKFEVIIIETGNSDAPIVTYVKD